MKNDSLLGMALEQQAPWQVTEVTLRENGSPRWQQRLRIGFVGGSKFKDEAVVDCAVR